MPRFFDDVPFLSFPYEFFWILPQPVINIIEKIREDSNEAKETDSGALFCKCDVPVSVSPASFCG
jgi:hypothetical protein